MVQTQEDIDRATLLVDRLADRIADQGVQGFNEVMRECTRGDLILLVLTLIIDLAVEGDE